MRPALSLAALAATLLSTLAPTAAGAATLTVCMAQDNPPLSHLVSGQPRGLDVRIAQAAAQALGRELVVLPFETAFEKESSLTHEVNALLSAGLCEAASGFPLLTSDLGPPSRPTSRTPDYPGAKRKRDRPFVPLGTLVSAGAYQSMALGVVLPVGAPPVNKLGDLGERRLGTVSGTLASALAMTWRNGALRPRLVSLSQREDALDELAQAAPPGGRRFEAALVPLALFDGWQLQHPSPAQPLQAAAYRKPIGINLGFVTLESAGEVRAALRQVLQQAQADGRLAAWAAQEGVSWSAPEQPEVGGGPGMGLLSGD